MDFTIVVPTYNGANRIEHCIRGIKNLIIPENLSYEIIFIDNNSTDNVVEIINQSNLSNYRIEKETTQGLFFARDRGIKESKSDWIFFIDDDIEVQPNWIQAFLDKIKISDNPGLLAAKLKFPLSYKISPFIEQFKAVYAITDNIDTKNYFLSSMFCVNKKCYEFLINNGFKQKLVGRLENSKIKAVGGEDIEYSLSLQYTDYNVFEVENTYGYHYLEENRLTENKCKEYLIASGYILATLAPLRYVKKPLFKYFSSYYYYLIRTFLSLLFTKETDPVIKEIFVLEKTELIKHLILNKVNYQNFEKEIKSAKWNTKK